MAASAETLFDSLGERYETAFSSSPYLLSTIRTAIDQLPPNARVLDIGSGTGNPTSRMLAEAGHTVHGIDVSNEMVKIASRQVPSATFEKADMRTYTPPNGLKFDAALAILSLFQITPGETYSVCFRFGEWVKPGGIVVVGVSPSNSLPSGVGTYDSTWDCVRYLGKPWMEQYTNETFFSKDAWRGMLAEAGFRVEAETFYDFVPGDEKHTTPERHHFFIARRVEGEPLLGPYPLPEMTTEKAMASVGRTSGNVADRLVSANLDNIYSELKGQGRVLVLGSTENDTPLKGSNIETYNGPLDTLPFPSGSFTTTFVPWQLDSILTSDLPRVLSEISRVTSHTAESQMLFIQGAPDNESVKIFNSTPQASRVRHQGVLLRSAIENMASHDFGNVSLRRVHARYEFPDGDVETKSEAAAALLMRLYRGGSRCEEVKGDLRSRLRLHFEDGTTTLGNDLVLLAARVFPN